MDKIRKALIVKPFDPVRLDGRRGDFHWALLMVRRRGGISIVMVWMGVTFVGR